MLLQYTVTLMSMENNTFYEYCYAAFHKPTKKWVLFENDSLELTVSVILLVEFKHCTISRTKSYLETFLKTSHLSMTPNYGLENSLEPKVFLNYGFENFLEFELAKIKTTYTIEK